MKKILVLVLLFPMFLFSQETIITDRPDQTESSSTIKRGSLQIESGVLVSFTENSLSSERQILAPTTLFRYGITKSIEIRLLNQFESIKSSLSSKSISGVSDFEIGTKIQIFKKESVNTEIAFLSHLIIPSGSSELSNDELGVINKLSVSHSINSNVGLGYNIGYNYFSEGDGDLTYSLVLGIGVTDKSGIYIESFGEFANLKVSDANFDAGFTYLVRENFQLDFSFGIGLEHKMNYLSAGFSWNLAR